MGCLVGCGAFSFMIPVDRYQALCRSLNICTTIVPEQLDFPDYEVPRNCTVGVKPREFHGTGM
jgi:hypothetical protein